MADPTDVKPDTLLDAASPTSTVDTKACPLCGETIKSVAIRCKHCQADLSVVGADFDRGVAARRPGPYVARSLGHSTRVIPTAPAAPSPPPAPSGPLSDAEFEQRFLDFAYETHESLSAISVAHALKIPIAQADERLELLAASDVINREVDDDGAVYYSLPGRHKRQQQQRALVPLMHGGLAHQSPIDPSLIIGPPAPTEAAAVTGLVLNLCMPGVGSIVAGKPGPGIAQLAMLVAGVPLCFVLIGFPLVFAAWLWSIMTAASALQEARRAPAT